MARAQDEDVAAIVNGNAAEYIVAGAGIAVRDAASGDPGVRGLLSPDNPFHLHAGVFAGEPLSRNIDQFDQELSRVVTELDVFRVQHILGQSLFSSGMVAVVELGKD